MTRFGVMRHLGVLEAAGLVDDPARGGREKRHYLNPVPIRLVQDRWISKYAEPVVGALAAMKRTWRPTDAAPDHVYSVFIKAAPDRVWRAITDGVETEQYYYGTRVDSDWSKGGRITYAYPDGRRGRRRGHRDRPGPARPMTFHARWDPEIEAEGPVTMAWEIEPPDDGARS